MTNPYHEELVAHGVPEELHERLSARGLGGLSTKMGIVFEQMSPELMRASMPVEGNTQPAGLLHGGAHLVLAETLASMAAAMHAGEGRTAVGIEINGSHHRGVRSGRVHAEARAITLGNTLTCHEVVMTDDDGKRLSTVRVTNVIRDIT